jgi:hypothetical protein
MASSADEPLPTAPSEASTEALVARVGFPVFSFDGERIGEIQEIYEDVTTEAPEWIGLGAGLFYAHRLLAPLRDAIVNEEGTLTLRHSKEAVTGSPKVEIEDGLLTSDCEAELFAYYDLGAPPPGPEDGPRLRLRMYPERFGEAQSAGSADANG